VDESMILEAMMSCELTSQHVRYRTYPTPLWAMMLGGLLALLFTVGFTHPALALTTNDLAKQTPIEVSISLSDKTNALTFSPNTLTFEAGKRYKLLLSNPSTSKHYFTAKDFADNIWSQKVDAGNVEIKGAIHELELKPGAVADWVFVPIKNGTYSLHCSIPGHTEAGMTGTLTITARTTQ
jgi:uncharacterized cupredoxin-like copper-binding protein